MPPVLFSARILVRAIAMAGTLCLLISYEALGSPSSVTVDSVPDFVETDGTLDLQFEAGKFSNGLVSAAILQPDGKLLIGGSFSQVHGVKRLDIARLNADGTLDLSFDPGNATPSLEVQGIALQPDGKIIVTRVAPLSMFPVSGFPPGAGRLTRLNSDGSLDQDFAPSHSISYDGIDDGSGNAVNPGIVHSVVIEPDGKIVAVGNFFRIITAPGSSVPRSGVARFNSDGSLDTSFDPGTGLFFSIGADLGTRGIHVVRQSIGVNDGKIIIQGWFEEFDSHAAWGLVRLNPDGSFDETFGNPGQGTNMFDVDGIFGQSDDRVIVYGNFAFLSSIYSHVMRRLTASGATDFGFAGTSLANYGDRPRISTIAQQPDGKLIVAGSFHVFGTVLTAHNVVRLETNGAWDSSFDGAGPGPSASEIAAVVVHPSTGKIFLGGSFSTFAGAPRNNIAWANSDGSLDNTFAGLPGVTDYNPAISVLGTQSDGKILAGGVFSTFDGGSHYNLVRLNPDSTIDPTFNPALSLDGPVRSLLIQPAGKIMIAGDFRAINGIERRRIARLNSDGTLDYSFNPGAGADGTIFAMAQDLAGNTFVGGAFGRFETTRSMVKLHPDGGVDTVFDFPYGPTIFSITPPDGAGRIVVGGSQFQIARLNGTTGALDLSFQTAYSAFDGNVRVITYAPNGKLYVGGEFTAFHGTPRPGIARLNNNGSLDESFVGPAIDGSVLALALQNGKIFVGGDFIDPFGPLIRLTGNGALDASFDPGSSFGVSPPGSYWALTPRVAALALQLDGKLLAGGIFNQYDGTSRSNLARLTGPATPTPTPGVLGNISTRGRVETGDNVLIGGFIVFGTQPKKILIRAIGPSLPLAGALADPTLELRDSMGTLILSNNDWRSSQAPAIIATGIPPSNDLESAIVATLPAYGSAYTAIMRGAGNGTGIGVVEVYDLDRTVDSKLVNISTRGRVGTGSDVLIAGTIALDQASQKVIIRALGPSLPVPGKLADPGLELRNANGVLLRANDNWRSDQETDIIATGIPPVNDLEAALVETLPASGAAYTAIVRGAGETSGVAVAEIYSLN
jgi:uncharacterized delta-60 repeat protein